MLVVLITIAAFWFTCYTKFNTIMKDFIETANSKQFEVNQYAQLSYNFIEFMGIYGNEFLMNGQYEDSELLKYLKYNNELKRYTLDSLKSSDINKSVGSLTGMEGIMDNPSNRAEVNLALYYNDYFDKIYKNLPGITWIYYTSESKFVNIYPWVSSKDFVYSDELFTKDFYTGGTPENNKSRSIYWSPVYLDLAGKGMLVTISKPVYANDTFKGIVSLDFTTEQLNSVINSMYGTILANEQDQILASTLKGSSSKDKIIFMADVLKTNKLPEIEELKNIKSNTLSDSGHYYIYVSKFSYAPWKIYNFLPKYSMFIQSFFFGLPVLIIGILLLLSNNEVHSKKITEEKLENTVEELKSYQLLLEKAAKSDYLTSTYNRRGLFERIYEEISRINRTGGVFSIIMADIDFFKSVNDRFGHAAGDKILIEISKILKKNIRGSDLVCRWGGEEFLLVLLDTEYEEALIIAEKLRKEIENTEIIWDDSLTIKITMTFGVNRYSRDMGFDKCVSDADKALYTGKRQGRNRVIGYSEKN